jgi:hypothetical protein
VRSGHISPLPTADDMLLICTVHESQRTSKLAKETGEQVAHSTDRFTFGDCPVGEVTMAL